MCLSRVVLSHATRQAHAWLIFDVGQNMTELTDPFTVKFGVYARTIEYHDDIGDLLFTFDIGSQDSIHLEHHGIRTPRPPNYDQAFARVKRFLESAGSKVEIDGDAQLPIPLTKEEAAALIRAQIGLRPSDAVSLLDPPHRGSFADDANGSRWELWLVAELSSGRQNGYKIVFDELTRQFGVVGPEGKFHGFWGSFAQTLEALCVR